MEMHDLEKYLPPPLKKGERCKVDNWKVRDQEFTVSEIREVIKYGLPSSMQDELNDHQEDYLSLTHEYWSDLLSTIKVKYNRKRAATEIKTIASARASSLYDIKGSIRIPEKNKASLGAGVLKSNKVPHNKINNYDGIQRHCFLYKKS